MFTKNSQYKYCPKFRTCPKKSIIDRPGIYNLQTRTVTFPDQEKLLGKVNLRYLNLVFAIFMKFLFLTK